MFVFAKNCLSPKNFGLPSFLCAVFQLFVLTLVAIGHLLRYNETGPFSPFTSDSGLITNTREDRESCFQLNKKVRDSSFPSLVFSFLSVSFPLGIAVIYSVTVSGRVNEIEVNLKVHRNKQNKTTVHVLYFYLIHLVQRSFLGILFTVIQYAYIHPKDFSFCCQCVTDKAANSNTKSAFISSIFNRTCMTYINPMESVANRYDVNLSFINIIIAFVLIGEFAYLWCRLNMPLNTTKWVVWDDEITFVTTYFLRKEDIEILVIYKQKILSRSCPANVNYIQEKQSGIDNMVVDFVIHTEPCPRKFVEDRHEMYDVHMKISEELIRLDTTKDLFLPNKDTKDKYPSRILAIGRSGIGKTVLAEKVLHDWAAGVDDIYTDKFVFLFKLRWFRSKDDKWKKLSLMKFLRVGTLLTDAEFMLVYENICCHKLKPILVFDGLHEVDDKLDKFVEESSMLPNDSNASISALCWFVKLVAGEAVMQSGEPFVSTVLVTSRPTVKSFHKKFSFDRNIEVIGLTLQKMENCVIRFCQGKNKPNKKKVIWNTISSSSELSSLCYIPVNCHIVCVTLSGCITDSKQANPDLPNTLAQLYQKSLYYFENHERDVNVSPMTNEELTKLQKLAFHLMEDKKLIIDESDLDETLNRSHFLNRFLNPHLSFKAQFSFVHGTIQEFLAAKHVTETFVFDEIKEFISKRVRMCRWHLVIKFIFGLLGIKYEMMNYSKKCIYSLVTNWLHLNGDDKQILQLTYNNVFALSCLKEVGSVEIIKEICENTDLDGVQEMISGYENLTESDWVAIAFVCRYMKNLTRLCLRHTTTNSFLLFRVKSFVELHIFQNTFSDEKLELDQVFEVLNEPHYPTLPSYDYARLTFWSCMVSMFKGQHYTWKLFFKTEKQTT
ncbi:NACHT, LRR and PYD domains-containing protein 12-like [Xenia sp. Carnegie-2017]|uniref:NACHT, LRR and PYD domains-containing protein 12-like n=1 Tax=Xenia sp. Carnegie-2017 TaxID=2897299 RepID=UPI001F0496A7|nr:NACHT, LRR and PYD domains-containing protein 12-like [Xenia sp. Carnegie-2017]